MSNSLPFGAIREALHDYFKSLNRAAPEVRSGAEARIRKEIGDRIGLLVSFSPILGKFFSDVEKTVTGELDQEKFFETLADLILCLGQPNELFVLLLDDVLATGGTMRACRDLVQQTGAELVACAFVIELTFLEGRARLAPVEVFSLIAF